ncbi:MAG: hypothetical protein JKY48_03370 [Flavobacteriales bacterium]|nr:hypothetical protein [Flavobacteriales bacterium]
MATTLDTSKLVESPPLQQIFNDINTAVAAKGTLRFFKDSARTEPKAVYVRSATPGQYDPFLEFELDNAGAVPYLFFFFPVSESNNSISEPYYVELKNQDGIIIFMRENFPPSDASSSSSGSNEVSNLCPSFGFESPVYPGYFNEGDNRPIGSNLNALEQGDMGWIVSFGWEYWVENFTNSNDFLAFTDLGDSGLEGNPQNSMTLKSNVTSPTTTFKRIGFRLGNVNDFQMLNVKYSIHWKWILQPPSSDEITVSLVRAPRGIGGTEKIISLGTIAVSTTNSRNELSFVVPEIEAGENYERWTSAYIYFELPQGVNFEIETTGTWSQLISSTSNISISEFSQGQKNSHLLWSTQKSLGSSDLTIDKSIVKLPIVWDAGRQATINTTGEIITRSHFSAPSNYSIPFSGVDYYNTEIIPETKTSPARFQVSVHQSPQVNGHTIYHSNFVNNYAVFFVQGGETFSSDWESSTASGSLVVSKNPVNTHPFEVIATTNGVDTVDLTYSSGLVSGGGGSAPSGWPYQWETIPPIGFPKSPEETVQRATTSNVDIRCWFDQKDTSNAATQVVNFGNGVVSVVQVSNSPVTCRLTFNSNNPLDYIPTLKTKLELQVPISSGSTFNWVGSSIYSNCVSWNMKADEGRQQTNYAATSQHLDSPVKSIVQLSPASLVMAYKNDSTNLGQILKGLRTTLYIDIQTSATKLDVVNATVTAINSSIVSDQWKVDVIAVPETGQYFTFSNSLHKFAGIFQRSGEAHPGNAPGDFFKSLVIKINAGDSFATVASKIASAITSWITYIPTASQAGLPEVPWLDYHLVA